jgi:hypothetical protein
LISLFVIARFLSLSPASGRDTDSNLLTNAATRTRLREIFLH